MAKYTTEIRTICESLAGLSESVGYSKIEETIEKSREKIFDFSFPIFDENYRSVLETKILKHFYTREIGLETYGLWKFKLNVKLNEIMPYYNQLYESTLLKFNPLYDVDITRTHKGTETGDKNSQGKNIETNTRLTNVNNTGNTNTNTNTTANSLDKYSDTPQGSVQNIADGTYLTNARIVEDSGNSATETTSSGSLNENENNTRNVNDEKKETLKNTEEYIETVIGKQGTESYSKILLEFRETFINIDMLVISELTDLFFNLW